MSNEEGFSVENLAAQVEASQQQPRSNDGVLHGASARTQAQKNDGDFADLSQLINERGQGEQQAAGNQETGDDSGDDRYIDRYKALEGKYRAEVPRLHEANRAKEQEILELRAKLDAFEKISNQQTTVANSQASGDAKNQPPRPMTQDEMVMAVIEDAAERKLNKLLAEREQASGGKEKELQKQIERLRLDHFERGVSDAFHGVDLNNEVFNDPFWVDFNNERIRGTHLTRGDALYEARRRGDAAAAADIIHDFLNQKAELTGRKPGEQEPSAKNAFDALAQPSKVSASQVPMGEKLLRSSDVEKLKNQLLNGNQGRAAYKAVADQISHAQANGRVRYQ